MVDGEGTASGGCGLRHRLTAEDGVKLHPSSSVFSGPPVGGRRGFYLGTESRKLGGPPGRSEVGTRAVEEINFLPLFLPSPERCEGTG